MKQSAYIDITLQCSVLIKQICRNSCSPVSVHFWIGYDFYQQGEIEKMFGLEHQEGLAKEREQIEK
jgi:hypothetical protein